MFERFSKFCISIPRKNLGRIEFISVLFIVLFSTVLYSFINWQKHIHFQTFAWDTSVFDQQVYLFSHFQLPYSSLMKMNGLGDHFHPLVLFFGGLLYKIWSDPRMLFILQSFIASISAIPLYLLAKHVFTKLKLTPFGIISISLGLIIMYLFSVAFQAMVLDEFHDDVLVTLPILWMVYFLYQKKWSWYWISYILVLLTKEEYGLLGVPLGLYIVLTQKEIKHTIFTTIVGIFTFYLLTFHIMPSLAGDSEYAHFLSENKPSTVAKNMVQNPALFITKFIDHKAKIKTLQTSLLSFGALPLFSPTNLILPISSLAIRFYDDTTPRRYEFNNHYASPFIPFLAVVSIFGLYNLLHVLIRKKWVNPKIIWVPVTAFLLSTVAFQDFQTYGPVNSIFKKSFYQTRSWEHDVHELIKHVPKHAVIAANNSLLAHLSQRNDFFLLPEIGNAQYVAVDLNEGPNKHAPLSAKKTREIINKIVATKQFEVVWQKNDALLLKRL